MVFDSSGDHDHCSKLLTSRDGTIDATHCTDYGMFYAVGVCSWVSEMMPRSLARRRAGSGDN